MSNLDYTDEERDLIQKATIACHLAVSDCVNSMASGKVDMVNTHLNILISVCSCALVAAHRNFEPIGHAALDNFISALKHSYLENVGQ